MKKFKDDMDSCLTVLNTGGIILYPTDTIWGIGCDATNEKAVQKIFSLKQRAESKSMIILVADEESILQYATPLPEAMQKLIAEYKVPVSMIYLNAKNLATNLIADDGSIAIRIIKDEFCNVLIRTFGKPIVSTSANISGQPFPENFKTISPEIKKGVNYVVAHRQDEESPSAPGRILKWTEAEGLTVIR
ncbi:MAG: L-threonylcarbamoyladenylate synthase [Ferruginibacter sp.]